MPYVTNLCCGAEGDCPAGTNPEHLPGCLVRAGAEWVCSCTGQYHHEWCDGHWQCPDGRKLTGEEMRAAAAGAWAIRYTADCEGDWTTEPVSGRRFATEADARAWWDAHYRGADEYGNEAYPEFVRAD